MSRLLGAVLAGGESRRFGSDKALALLDGRPLIAHAIDALAPQVSAVVVTGRTHPGVRSVADRPAPGLGPLGGLNAALHLAAADRFDAVVSIACDVPELPADLVTRLLAAGRPAFVADSPVTGIWPAALAPALDRHIGRDPRRSMRGWAAAVDAMPITLATPLANVNSPDALSRLRRSQ